MVNAGEPNIKEKLFKAYKAGKKKFKAHLDGYNILDYFKKDDEGDGPRKANRYLPYSGYRLD